MMKNKLRRKNSVQETQFWSLLWIPRNQSHIEEWSISETKVLTSPSQNSMSLTLMLNVCCLLASFNFIDLVADSLVRYSHWSPMVTMRFWTAFSVPAHWWLSINPGINQRAMVIMKNTSWSDIRCEDSDMCGLYWILKRKVCVTWEGMGEGRG